MMENAQRVVYQNDREVEEVVRKFESCELLPADFNHREHLVVALYYLRRMSDAEALERLRAAIDRYVRAHGIVPSLYHETVTVFWLRRVRAFISLAGDETDLVALANRLTDECGPSRLIHEYYSRERLDSAEARRDWREPDLRPLDF